MSYPQLPHEVARLQALVDLQILDTPPEARFDAITSAAQDYFNSSSALISLVAEDRQWFKSKQGLDAKETPRNISFCTYAIAEEFYLLVPDALADDRFANNPLVKGEPYIRAYAGVILHSSGGYEIGTLCVLFAKARTFSEEDIAMLQHFGKLVERELHGK
ncbi:GAF domain-containing protein [Alteromonas sp. H39]|uniref:GAF domain-containing protein n=1 Tax=Alteromonas sp. H39 TaxID=3389876 RepID=UPI0039E182BD